MTNLVVALTLATNLWTNPPSLLYTSPGPDCPICRQAHHDLQISTQSEIQIVTATGQLLGKPIELTVNTQVLRQWNVTNVVPSSLLRAQNPNPWIPLPMPLTTMTNVTDLLKEAPAVPGP